MIALSSRFRIAVRRSSADPRHPKLHRTRHRSKLNRLSRQVMPCQRNRNTLRHQRLKLQNLPVPLTMPLTKLASLQNLFDGRKQPVGIRMHDPVELLPLLFGSSGLRCSVSR